MKENIIDFTLIYNKYKKPLFNYSYKIVRAEMLAEDIMQNVFLKLYDNMSRIRHTELVEVWIFRTARNEAFTHFRRTKNKIEEDITNYESVLPSSNLVNDFEQQELINLIEDELRQMDSAQSEVYYLKEYSGLSYKEIAEIMGITEDLVRSRIFKVRQKLRTAIIKLERG
ncbi:MAG: sigma-70 family RNA polymerase sigma factor [Ignavibacteria bacterium]|nr:sigma-70 family RNA polymerase sigma factor [Ignavibacteria bacterium]